MKKTVWFLLCLLSGLCLLAQQDLGIQNSNYAGIRGTLLNPSSIADSKLKWDVNILSGDVVFANTFLYAPKNAVPVLGFKKIIEGSIHENLFYTHFDPQNPNKLYNLSLSTEILGPSFFVKLAKNQEIGLTIAGRASANIKNISGNMAQNAFAYFLESDLWNSPLHDNTARVNSMGWLEYGLHYATVLYRKGRDELKGGISLNYLQGIAAVYVKNTNINYRIVDTTGIVFTNSSVDYGRTNIDTYKKIGDYGDLNHGHGFGMDIGYTFVHLKDQATYTDEPAGKMWTANKNDYLYRLGISLLDAGSINFSRNAATYHLQTAEGDFTNWRQAKFSGNAQLDQTLSAVFYNGDSTRSLTSNHFTMSLPTALSVQADWDVYQNFFADVTIIKGLGHGNKQGVTRPDIYSLTPRYETRWGELSVPMSLLYYNHWLPQVGLAVRVGYFFIGGDGPGSLLKLNNLESADFYAGVHYFIPENTKNH